MRPGCLDSCGYSLPSTFIDVSVTLKIRAFKRFRTWLRKVPICYLFFSCYRLPRTGTLPEGGHC